MIAAMAMWKWPILCIYRESTPTSWSRTSAHREILRSALLHSALHFNRLWARLTTTHTLSLLLSLSLRLWLWMSSISSLTDLDDLDISDTSDIEDFNMSATGGAAAGAAILPGYRHPGIQSGFAGLSRQTLLDMHSDPARIIRTFNGSYKSMKLQPKIELLDGANNYALWCQRMTCILESL